jgi:hypothetical protein
MHVPSSTDVSGLLVDRTRRVLRVVLSGAVPGIG